MKVRRKHFWAAWVVVIAFCARGARAAEVVETDVCVYGGTSGGVVAAVQVARMGKRVLLIEPGQHLGGMSSGGLGWTDFGNKSAIGGLSRDFYRRVGKRYGKEEEYTLEPHVAEEVFEAWVAEATVPVWRGRGLAAVEKRGAHLTSVTMEDGGVCRAAVFIDATYEGDLLAKAGVSYVVGREANATYGETLNGVQGPATSPNAGKFLVKVDPFVRAGDPTSGLLPMLDGSPHGTVGAADRRVQSYNYRVCLTARAENRLSIDPPADYAEGQYELLARWIEARIASRETNKGRTITAETIALSDFLKYDPLPNGKFDFNNRWPISTDFIGGADEYPEATPARRARIAKAHEDYLRGFFHFLTTSERVPQRVRAEMSRFGLCKDEFTSTGGWPHQLYVREARRMVGDFVMTQQHCTGAMVAADPVGLGAYGIDMHAVRRLVIDGQVTNEGSNGGGVKQPYPIGYAALVPKAAECDNLFAPFCLSASHVAFGSIRMEPVFMTLSQASGTAACIAIDEHVAVQRVDYPKLRERLLADGVVLEWAGKKEGIQARRGSGSTGATGVAAPGTT